MNEQLNHIWFDVQLKLIFSLELGTGKKINKIVIKNSHYISDPYVVLVFWVLNVPVHTQVQKVTYVCFTDKLAELPLLSVIQRDRMITFCHKTLCEIL